MIWSSGLNETVVPLSLFFTFPTVSRSVSLSPRA